MPDISLREAFGLLRFAGRVLLVRAGIYVLFGLVGTLVALAVESLVQTMISGGLGQFVGLAMGLFTLPVVFLAVRMLPLSVPLGAPTLAIAWTLLHAPTPRPTYAALKQIMVPDQTSSMDFHRFCLALSQSTYDVFRLVQGLSSLIPRALARIPHAIWLGAIVRPITDIVFAEVMLVASADRGGSAQASMARVAEAARGLVRLAWRPVLIAWSATAFIGLVLLLPSLKIANLVEGGADGVTAVALAAFWAWVFHKSVSGPLLTAFLLPGALDLLHRVTPNPHWAPRLKMSSPAWLALGGQTTSGNRLSRQGHVIGRAAR